MSMNLSVYVGPYLTFDREGFDWFKYDGLFSDGRMEAASPGERRHLIPNRVVPGIDRQMQFEKNGNDGPEPLSVKQIADEILLFQHFASEAIDDIRKNGHQCNVRWGVVPCWS